MPIDKAKFAGNSLPPSAARRCFDARLHPRNGLQPDALLIPPSIPSRRRRWNGRRCAVYGYRRSVRRPLPNSTKGHAGAGDDGCVFHQVTNLLEDAKCTSFESPDTHRTVQGDPLWAMAVKRIRAARAVAHDRVGQRSANLRRLRARASGWSCRRSTEGRKEADGFGQSDLYLRGASSRNTSFSITPAPRSPSAALPIPAARSLSSTLRWSLNGRTAARAAALSPWTASTGPKRAVEERL